MVGIIDSYLGEAARRRACNHGGSHTLLSRSAISDPLSYPWRMCPPFSIVYLSEPHSGRQENVGVSFGGDDGNLCIDEGLGQCHVLQSLVDGMGDSVVRNSVLFERVERSGSSFGEPRKHLLDSTFVTGTVEATGGHASVPPISATSDYAIPSSKRLRVNTHQHVGSESLMSTNDPLTTLGGVQIPVNNSATHIECSVQHEICTNGSTSTPVNVRMSMEDFTAGINRSGPSTSKRRRVHSHEHGGNSLVIGGRLTRTDHI
ncbi:hypothetical protein Tco_1105942 [Tanacetum coccineum]